VFFQFATNLGCSFRTLFLYIFDGMLENNIRRKHIKKSFKTTRMHHDESASNLEIQVFQTNI
jgi:hypothetical protein